MVQPHFKGSVSQREVLTEKVNMSCIKAWLETRKSWDGDGPCSEYFGMLPFSLARAYQCIAVWHVMGSVKLGSLREAIDGRTQRGQAAAHRNQVEVPSWGRMFWWVFNRSKTMEMDKNGAFLVRFFTGDGKWHTAPSDVHSKRLRWFNLDMDNQLLQIAGCFLENCLENHPHIQFNWLSVTFFG